MFIERFLGQKGRRDDVKIAGKTQYYYEVFIRTYFPQSIYAYTKFKKKGLRSIRL